jgi:signal transduction histidine kinase
MTARRRRVLGLRGRLVIALVVTSIATLTAAGLIILPPLTHRLVSDRLGELRGLARTGRPALRGIPRDEIHRGSRTMLRIADHLGERTGARILIYDDADTAVADTAATHPRIAIDDLEGERRRAGRHHDDVTTGRRGDVAYAVTAVRDGRERLTLVILKRLSDTRAADAVVRAAFPLALAVGVLVALALALLFSRSLLRRLRALQADARALGEDGLGHPVRVAGGDEVAEVAHALEGMRARLVEEEASRQAFVATASHELRTPLASLQATLELLREDVLEGRGDPDATAARADTALRQTHRLVALASDLLDLSRVDGDVPLRLEPLELGELARLIAHEVEQRLDAEGRAIEVDGGPALVVGDPNAVARILRILLDNARSYGAGTVTVRIAGDVGRVVLTVADEGPGLGPGEEEAVFLRFTRGRAAGDVPGAGLGLAIARGLARAMGGDLDAEPSAGRGACFALALPVWTGEALDPAPHRDRMPS